MRERVMGRGEAAKEWIFRVVGGREEGTGWV